MKHKNNLELKYAALLQLAEQATSRKEAIHLIHQADKTRQEMCRQTLEHPLIYQY